MVLVLEHLEVLVRVVEDRRRPALDVQQRVGMRRARQLQFDLLGVVAVDVAVAAGPDEVADLEVAPIKTGSRLWKCRWMAMRLRALLPM